MAKDPERGNDVSEKIKANYRSAIDIRPDWNLGMEIPLSPELNPDELIWNNARQKVAKRKHSVKKGEFKEFVNGIMKEI